MMRHLCFAFTVLSVLSGTGEAAWAQGTARQCLSPGETLTTIGERRLVRPSEALASAAVRASAEAVGARLCRWADAFVYEITLLRSDGRVLRVFVDAASGKPAGGAPN